MNKLIEERVYREAELYLQPNQTFRSVSLIVHVSKSTVSHDLTKRIKELGEPELIKQVTETIAKRREGAPAVARGVRLSKYAKEYTDEHRKNNLG